MIKVENTFVSKGNNSLGVAGVGNHIEKLRQNMEIAEGNMKEAAKIFNVAKKMYEETLTEDRYRKGLSPCCGIRVNLNKRLNAIKCKKCHRIYSRIDFYLGPRIIT